MGIISKPWKAYNAIKTALTGGKQKTTGTEVISAVSPNVPKTKLEKTKSNLAIAKQKTKASQAKLDNTIFRIEQQKKRLEEKKAKGGRVGLKRGTFPDHSGDGKITQKDILMAKGVIPKPKGKKSKSPMDKQVRKA